MDDIDVRPWWRRLASRLESAGRFRVIGFRNNHVDPYIYRYFVFKSKLVSVFLHRIVRSDDSQDFHDHPFPFFHVILEGGYIEEAIGRGRCTFVSRKLLPGWWALHRAGYAHRIDLYFDLEKPQEQVYTEAWTLMVIGPRYRDWGFYDRVTRCWTQWEKYVNGQRC